MEQQQTEDLSELAASLKNQGTEFAVATVVRTVSVTAAKPGAKALLSVDGEILSGWIGGGCARHAVASAARKAIADGEPRLVQLKPEELLDQEGLTEGELADGVVVARNLCPSRGTMDIFIEPVIADPELLVLGHSPIAVELTRLAGMFGFSVVISDTVCVSDSVSLTVTDIGNIRREHSHRYVVISTQGSGDLAAIESALQLQFRYLTFVGSYRKVEHLRGKLRQNEWLSDKISLLNGPAGLDIGAVTPQEIALSILAELVQIRRSNTTSTRITSDHNA